MITRQVVGVLRVDSKITIASEGLPTAGDKTSKRSFVRVCSEMFEE